MLRESPTITLFSYNETQRVTYRISSYWFLRRRCFLWHGNEHHMNIKGYLLRMFRKLRRFVKLTVLLFGLILTITLVAGPGFLSGKGDFVNRDSSDRGLQLTQDVQNINSLNRNQVMPVRVSDNALLSSDGYRLAKRLSDKCVGYSRRHISNQKEAVFASFRTGSTDVCVIWKAGTTLIRRLFMMKNEIQYRGIVNPYDIYFGEEYTPRASIRMDPAVKRMIFVRDPYKRLYSVFIDKLLAPNPIYWTLIGVNAIRLTRTSPSQKSLTCGHDLTFAEFIKYVILTLDPVLPKQYAPDGHFNSQVKMCRPCAIKYDFVGKMESFREDSLELVKQIELSNTTADILQERGDMLRADDALRDSCHQPFDSTFRGGLPKCVTFYEALQRAWSKMQMRGLIGPIPFPVTQEQASNITENDFVKLAKEAHGKFTETERNRQKEEHFANLYATVPKLDLNRLRIIHKDEFSLFEYDASPSSIFG